MECNEGGENSCFGECNCQCDQRLNAFDEIIRNETKFGFTLSDITHSNIGWYVDRTQLQESWMGSGVGQHKTGVYILWHKNDYCPRHDLFHMKALYVGKGSVDNRLKAHFRDKNTSDEKLVYFTYFECSNRVAKYIEQLLLDLFNFPLNISENPGENKLCDYFDQGEVD